MAVQCTWKSLDGTDLGKAVTWTSEGESQSFVDVEDEVQAENCLFLVAPSAGTSEYLTVPACQLLFSCQQHEQIQHLSILSEARVLEVYGHHGEYLKTVRSELLEEVEGMAVFKGDIVLERPLHLCSIKFACLRSKVEMWLYGVKVNVSKATDIHDSPLKISLAEVEQRLQDMGLTLSDKAGAFKQLLEHQQNFSKSLPQDMTSLVQAMNFMNLIPGKSSPIDGSHASDASLIKDAEKDTGNQNEYATHAANGFKPTTSNEVNNNPTISFHSSSSQTDGPLPPDELDVLKTHIEEKIAELDTKLWERIEKRIVETETKLLCKLDEIESFVKPQGVK